MKTRLILYGVGAVVHLTSATAGTRDTALAGKSNFHRALVRAGVNAKLIIFDALPHAFWYEVAIPESREALEYQAKFFDQQLGR